MEEIKEPTWEVICHDAQLVLPSGLAIAVISGSRAEMGVARALYKLPIAI